MPSIFGVYQQLKKQYGNQHWWPADSPFEVMVGAILTQNTAWTNVEKAIAKLKEKEWLSPDALASIRRDQLARAIRPSGYFNIKAKRLQSFCRWYLKEGADLFVSSKDLEFKRRQLLKVHGIGPETADDILLYALELPVFVVDAYTRRIFSRLGLLEVKAPYDIIRQQFEHELPVDTKIWGEYHALIVQHAKYVCKKKPECEKCSLKPTCKYEA